MSGVPGAALVILVPRYAYVDIYHRFLDTRKTKQKTKQNKTKHLRKRFQNFLTLVAVIGGFRSDLSITRKTDGNFGGGYFKK